MIAEVRGVHHVKIPVSDLARSRAWYEQLLELTVELEFRDDDGAVRGVVYQDLHGFTLALREDPARAAALAGFNPVAALVEGPHDLYAAADRLSSGGIPHSGVVRATLGWMLSVPDPDGIELRFYTRSRHTERSQPAGRA